MTARVVSKADVEVQQCLETGRSFALIAGAGSGKTTSLLDALAEIRAKSGAVLRQNGQRIACITYTKRAVAVIQSRLGFDDLYAISTLHSFLWSELGRFQHDIREALRVSRVPAVIAATREKDNGGQSKQARRARERASELEKQLAELEGVKEFAYDDAPYSNYGEGRLSHDDIVAIASYCFAEKPTFRRLVGLRFPYIFVDEAQDTFDGIVSGLNLTCAGIGLPLVGYFGDPWQQIYDGRARDFGPPPDGATITKTENFRCSTSVIDFLNAFRTDLKQYPAGENSGRTGSVTFRLIGAEKPALPRNRYSDEQSERAFAKLDKCLKEWDWQSVGDVKQLFLVRQMIARRLGFPALNHLFNGDFASARAQEEYESGEHFLLKPFIEMLCPLIAAHQQQDTRQVIDLLRRNSEAYAIDGPNRDRSLGEMVKQASTVLTGLEEHWRAATIRDVLCFCRDNGVLKVSDRLSEQLSRSPRAETYDDDVHAIDKADWLCDAFFGMGTKELSAYREFVQNNTPYSTQHGVKGEEYSRVLVVFDDIEAAWSNYNFGKLLTPIMAGEATEGQRERGRKLAYVCFSRAMEHLRVVLFTSDPTAASKELIDRKLLRSDQIEIS